MAARDVWYNDQSGALELEFKITLGISKSPDKISSHWHGPFKDLNEAAQWVYDNKAAHPEWKEPTTNFYKQLTQGTQTTVQNATEDIFLGTNAQNWFIRVGEVLLGIVLIGIGVAKLTGTANAVSNLVKARIP